jgi:hypothetical protein
MSTERTLAGWITDLVSLLHLDPAGGGERLRLAVEGRTARITLDDETVMVSMSGGELLVGPDRPGTEVDGSGSTTSGVVLDILDANLEASTAVERGLIEVIGAHQQTTRLFHAVELLLDASSRVPELRRLAAEFRSARAASPRAALGAAPGLAAELELLDGLGLGRFR